MILLDVVMLAILSPLLNAAIDAHQHFMAGVYMATMFIFFLNIVATALYWLLPYVNRDGDDE